MSDPSRPLPAPMPPVTVAACTLTTALGRGREPTGAALASGRTGLRPNDFTHEPLTCWIGRVDGIEDAPLPPEFTAWDCRNNRLAWMGLHNDRFLDDARAAVARHGADRVAVVMGTSTGSIAVAEAGYHHLEGGHLPATQRDPRLYSLHSLGAFVAVAVGARGPCMTLSTACSSSAKAIASGARMLQAGLADAAIVGGVDSLCDSVLFGFNALGLVARGACRPFDRERDGISIGEGAGFLLLERAAGNDGGHALLVGYGESSDAHHMSSPHPEGLGFDLAIDAALARAGCTERDVGCINLHGTATRMNDAVEAAVVARRFPAACRYGSTKGFTGHTLGAAGAVEAAIAIIALDLGFVPANLGSDDPDPACGPGLVREREVGPFATALSNSFEFGGNNACLMFAKPSWSRP